MYSGPEITSTVVTTDGPSRINPILQD